MTIEPGSAAANDQGQAGQDAPQGPTAAQLRRFIKSRAYVPLHELRRRFELNGDLDEVTPVEVPDLGQVFVGLRPREAEFLAGLARDGEVGLELSQDPHVPIVVGVYAMRPVSRA
jgi:hypothetical protein